MKTFYTAAAIALIGASTASHADMGVTASVGTTGVGLHLSMPLKTDLNARVGGNFLNVSRDGNTSNVNYDFKLEMRSFDALLDYFPMDGTFRLSGGLVYNGNKIKATGKPTAAGTFRLNGNTYSAASVGSLDGQIDFRKLSPYLGIGWGNAVAKDKGWGFSADLGVLLQGTPRTSLTNSGCTASAAICAQLASDIAAENRALSDEVKNFKAYPVVRVGASYRF